MNSQVTKANILLFFVAFFWGMAFIAQRIGLQYVDPLFFNGVRFLIGAVFLIPVIYAFEWKIAKADREKYSNHVVYGGVLAGIVLFLGSIFQQIGLVYTTAGKAGFITGLYVVIVPIIGLLIGVTLKWNTMLGAILAAAGLYFLSVTDEFTIEYGDFLVLISAFFWAAHILILDRLSPKVCPLRFTLVQVVTTAIISFIIAFFVEDMSQQHILPALLPSLYLGVFSIGVAFTIQIIAQKHALPSHAAIILSLEAVIAAAGGWLFLNEVIDHWGLLGCALMLTGMMIAQFPFQRSKRID